MPSLPKSLPKWARARIMYFDDERDIGHRIIITLENGWYFDEPGRHVFGADNVARLVKEMRQRTKPCHCDRCRN